MIKITLTMETDTFLEKKEIDGLIDLLDKTKEFVQMIGIAENEHNRNK